jgi:hypothetical protein
LGLVVGVDVVTRRADQGAALGGVELRDGLEERVEEDVGDARVEEAVEALDEADDFDLELVGALDGAVDGGVEGGRVAAGRQDPDALHECPPLVGSSSHSRDSCPR